MRHGSSRVNTGDEGGHVPKVMGQRKKDGEELGPHQKSMRTTQRLKKGGECLS
jgi:hypothetical protein